jgi:hypothetical protein
MRRFVRNFFSVLLQKCVPSTAFIAFLILAYLAIPYFVVVSLGLLFLAITSYKVGKYLQVKTPTLLGQVAVLDGQKTLLKSAEIESFKKIANVQDMKRLECYENYINDVCIITYTEIKSLNSPITIEHANENPHFAKTYEKEALLEWIKQKGSDTGDDNIPEPQKNWYRLSDPNIKIYAGFPTWVTNFVREVLETLKNPPLTKREKIAEERGQFYQKHFKSLFSHTKTPIEKKELLHPKNRLGVA